jgi:hypothetical protein
MNLGIFHLLIRGSILSKYEVKIRFFYSLNALAKGRASSTSSEGRLFGRNVFQRIVMWFSTALQFIGP